MKILLLALSKKPMTVAEASRAMKMDATQLLADMVAKKQVVVNNGLYSLPPKVKVETQYADM